MTRNDNGKTIGKTAGLFAITLPHFTQLLAMVIAIGAISGFVTELPYASSLPEAFLYGSAAGIVVFSVPAVLAALIAASTTSRRDFRNQIKYYVFTALVGMAIISITYAASMLALGGSSAGIALFLLANALVFAMWYATLAVPLGKSLPKALGAAIIHPVLSLAFSAVWRKVGLSTHAFAMPFWLSLPKLFVAAAILIAAVLLIFRLLNAPAKKAIGISAVQSATLFFAHWLRGSDGLEEALDDIGSPATTTIGGVVFKDTKSGRLKSAFLAPNVHFGPFGTVGGSQLPAIICDEIHKSKHITPLVFHGTVYHDFNPVNATERQRVVDAFAQAVSEAKTFSKLASVSTSTKGIAEAAAMQFGHDAFITITPAPYPNGDIDFASGTALSLAAEKTFGTAVVADRHSSKGEMEMWEVGSESYYEFEDAINALSAQNGKPFSLGVAHDPLEGMLEHHGVGRAGLRVAVLETGGKQYAYAVFDANNTTPQLREKCIKLFAVMGFEFADVCTTDTHSVNTPSQPHNSLGENASEEALLEALEKTIARAREDLTPCSAAVFKRRFTTRIIGTNRANELMTTMRAIVAVARIAVPIILVASVIIALLAIVVL